MEKCIFSAIHTYQSTHKNKYVRVEDGSPIPDIQKVNGCLVTEVRPTPSREVVHKNPIVILYAHGNKWDLGRLLERPFRPTGSATLKSSTAPQSLLEIIADSGRVPVVAFEYPGFGADAPGNVSITGAVDAMLNVYSHLVTKRVCRVIVHGFSIGTGVTAAMVHRLHTDPQLASLPKPAGMILQSASESRMRMYTSSIMSKGLMKLLRIGGADVYDTSKVIADLVEVPVVGFIHGAKDRRCAISGAKRMARQVEENGAKQIVMTYWDAHANHNDLPLRKGFSTFLEKFTGAVVRHGTLRVPA